MPQPTEPGGPLERDTRSREWVWFVPALLLLAMLAVADYLLGRSVVVIGLFAVAPFLTAFRGARSATVAISVLTVGVTALSGTWNGNYDEADFWVRLPLIAGASLFACYSAWVIDKNERNAEERAEIAGILQQGLRPPELPDIAGWSVAARYRAAGDQNLVGGDFYDFFRLESGWMVVIGDVTGHGARAASVTALARFTLRTAGALTGNPADALAELNRALIAEHRGPLCSVAAVTLDQSTEGSIRYAVAGHPPPLLIVGDEVDEIAASGPVLGAFEDSVWEVGARVLDHGDQLFLYTDGVTEARAQAEMFGGGRLAGVLAGASVPEDAVDQVDRAIADFNAGELTDDAAFLAIMRTAHKTDPAHDEAAAASRLPSPSRA